MTIKKMMIKDVMLMYNQVLITSTIKKYTKYSKENVHVAGA